MNYRIDISNAVDIPGWMSETELFWLAMKARDAHRIIEIGSWRGRSTRAMADNTQGIVFAIDTWDDAAVGIPGWWTTQPTERHETGWLWREFCKNMSSCFNVTTFRMKSSVAAGLMRHSGRIFDMIFIDASHDMDSVREDIYSWRPLLAPGGVFCGHDYGHKNCPDVKSVVDALIGKINLIDTIWMAA